MSIVAKLLLSKQRQSFLPLLLSTCGKETQSNKFRNLCFQNDSQGNGPALTSFKDRLIQKYIHPKDHEVLVLKETFPEPKQLFGDVFKPIVETDRSKSPSLYIDRAFGRNIFKARLQLHWPHTLLLTGSHVNEDKAIENVYLLACDLLKDMGFIQRIDDKCAPMNPETVLKFLERFGELGASAKDMFKNVNTLESRKDEEGLWLSTLHLDWPVSFTVSSEARKMSLAFHEVCLLTAMRLKALGFLDGNNQLKNAIVLRMRSPRCELEDFQPDAEIYADASRVGMGAYLLFSDDDTVRWISDFWPEKFYFDPILNSSLTEFYAVVTAVFTWKHKLKNKKLLCYSDNSSAVHIINHGWLVVGDFKRKKAPDAKFEKLYKTLCDTCRVYNITLVGRHVMRVDNVPADLLSRNKVKAFQRRVPTAKPMPKKSKKLEFCKPKDDHHKPDTDKKK